jgi:hypothetical protein
VLQGRCRHLSAALRLKIVFWPVIDCDYDDRSGVSDTSGELNWSGRVSPEKVHWADDRRCTRTIEDTDACRMSELWRMC